MTNLNINIFEDINVVLFPAKEHGLSQNIIMRQSHVFLNICPVLKITYC